MLREFLFVGIGSLVKLVDMYSRLGRGGWDGVCLCDLKHIVGEHIQGDTNHEVGVILNAVCNRIGSVKPYNFLCMKWQDQGG